MSHWMLETLGKMRAKAMYEATRAQVLGELANQLPEVATA